MAVKGRKWAVTGSNRRPLRVKGTRRPRVGEPEALTTTRMRPDVNRRPVLQLRCPGLSDKRGLTEIVAWPKGGPSWPTTRQTIVLLLPRTGPSRERRRA